MVTEKLTTACLLTATMLGWFMSLDMLGVELGVSLVTWAVIAPLLLYPLLGRLTRNAASRARREMEIANSQKMLALLNYLHGQMDQSVRTMVASCARLIESSRAKQLDAEAVSKEAATIHYEVIKLGDVLSRMNASAMAGSGEGGLDAFGRPVAPREGRRSISGYIRRAASSA
jgi:hypothetical protein